MKIAYVLNTYPQPSHSFIRREIHALERAGFEVLRLAMRRFDDELVDPANEGERQRTEYVLKQGAGRLLAGFLRLALRHPGSTLRALRVARQLSRNAQGKRLRHLAYVVEAAHVARRCRDEGVQHVHCHFGTNAPAIAMLAQIMGGVQYSFTVHGPEEFDTPEALSLGEKIRRSAFAVGVSEFGRSQLYRWAGFDVWDRVKVVQCGIEPHVFPKATPFPALPPLRVVTIGRFVEQKGQLTLVHAMARLKESHPEIHLTLVGDGQMRPAIEKAIRAVGIEDRITLTGWVGEDRVNAELENAHAIIMPSFAEGLPMVLMEAMATGRPVISTFVAGIPELVTPDCGWLVPAGDVKALADALIALSETPVAQMAEMGAAGRERVLARHDVDVEASKLAGHIRAAVG
ncbi:glycosyltransferase [Oceaniglobus trochenteri]|uniref:glycosyltransferase n=1 Tax=Oceaniglobus trochenteri TaxID=2763260 RepID=UPI001CFFAD62